MAEQHRLKSLVNSLPFYVRIAISSQVLHSMYNGDLFRFNALTISNKECDEIELMINNILNRNDQLIVTISRFGFFRFICDEDILNIASFLSIFDCMMLSKANHWFSYFLMANKAKIDAFKYRLYLSLHEQQYFNQFIINNKHHSCLYDFRSKQISDKFKYQCILFHVSYLMLIKTANQYEMDLFIKLLCTDIGKKIIIQKESFGSILLLNINDTIKNKDTSYPTRSDYIGSMKNIIHSSYYMLSANIIITNDYQDGGALLNELESGLNELSETKISNQEFEQLANSQIMGLFFNFIICLIEKYNKIKNDELKDYIISNLRILIRIISLIKICNQRTKAIISKSFKNADILNRCDMILKFIYSLQENHNNLFHEYMKCIYILFNKETDVDTNRNYNGLMMSLFNLYNTKKNNDMLIVSALNYLIESNLYDKISFIKIVIMRVNYINNNRNNNNNKNKNIDMKQFGINCLKKIQEKYVYSPSQNHEILTMLKKSANI